MENKVFTYYDSKNQKQEIVISEGDFSFVQEKAVIKDQKLQRKPTTFFKDALKRFRKNKSSVAGAIVLGVIALFTIFVPIFDTSETGADIVHASEKFLEPKLFAAGTGWWDGCRQMNNITIEVDWEKYEETGEIEGLPVGYAEKDIVGGRSGITMSKVGEKFTNVAAAYNHGGFVRLFSGADANPTITSPSLSYLSFAEDYGYTLTVTTEDPSSYSDYTFGEVSPYSVSLSFVVDGESKSVPLLSGITNYGATSVNLYDFASEVAEAYGEANPVLRTSNEPEFVITIDEGTPSDVENVLIKSFVLSSTEESQAEVVAEASFTDANNMIYYASSLGWTFSPSNVSVFHADIVTGSFRFDTYENAYGNYLNSDIPMATISTYKSNGWIDIDLSYLDGYQDMSRSELREAIDKCLATFSILDEAHCPIVNDGSFTGTSVSAGGRSTVTFSGNCTRWKELYPGRDSMPSFLFGTDANGRDMWKYVFMGLQTSLLLGVCAFLVCFTFGLVWGAIAGYFGGWTDILMERFVEILSGVPWIVVMTLAMIQFGRNMTTFAMAICLTGWIGTSGITRTQFYRYKDREYILAARTLGARDSRLIFRHILPNAMGTIITSSVLMIPSVIYSEATISYLGLGLQGTAALGVILSENQQYIQNQPHLILFPSAVMALLMISFNLFGNGLRDAFNPSLKGQE